MKIQVVDRHGRIKSMPKRYADVLVKMKRVSVIENTYGTRAMVAQSTLPVVAPALLVSDAVVDYADENEVDVSVVVGTGANGRINKKDIDSVIAARKSQE